MEIDGHNNERYNDTIKSSNETSNDKYKLIIIGESRNGVPGATFEDYDTLTDAVLRSREHTIFLSIHGYKIIKNEIEYGSQIFKLPINPLS